MATTEYRTFDAYGRETTPLDLRVRLNRLEREQREQKERDALRHQLPPALAAERDRMLTAATAEHHKNVAREAERFVQELRSIDTTYRRLAAEQSS